MVQILDVERVIVAFSNDSHEEMLDLIRSLKDLDIQIDLVPRFFEVIGTNVGIHTAEGLPLIGLPGSPALALVAAHQADDGPRALDHRARAPRAALRSPSRSGSSSTRAGPSSSASSAWASGDQTFEILKFRTMGVDADERKHELAALNKHDGRRRPAHVQDPERPAGHRGSARCCAASPSTSCPS